MNYTDLGYDEFLSKDTPATTQEIDPFTFDNFVANFSGSKIEGGVLISQDKKISVDLDNGTFKVNDGTIDRTILGNLPDGKIGLLIQDSKGNLLMQISEGKNIIKDSQDIINLDFDNAQLLLKENGNPIMLIGNQTNGF